MALVDDDGPGLWMPIHQARLLCQEQGRGADSRRREAAAAYYLNQAWKQLRFTRLFGAGLNQPPSGSGSLDGALCLRKGRDRTQQRGRRHSLGCPRGPEH